MTTPPARPTRRPRYAGRNPRRFHEKYKELDPARYAEDVDKVLASGKTPAGSHRSIMVSEILAALRPQPGEVVADCTLGYGGHARTLLEAVLPGGRLLGLDVDPLELPRTETRLRLAGFGPDVFTAHRSNFAGLPQVLAAEGLAAVNVMLADLGVSSMQLDNPDRGFTFREAGPLDMRMNPTRGEPASRLLARLSVDKLAQVLMDHADEPEADLIATALTRTPIDTTRAAVAAIRAAFEHGRPGAGEADIDKAIRRTFQALRIAVNDEFSALDAFLRNLSACLAPGGRVAVLTFHSGEDRRVKKAFQAGLRDGLFSAIAEDPERAAADEVRANPRAASAKLRWAVRA